MDTAAIVRTPDDGSGEVEEAVSRQVYVTKYHAPSAEESPEGGGRSGRGSEGGGWDGVSTLVGCTKEGPRWGRGGLSDPTRVSVKLYTATRSDRVNAVHHSSSTSSMHRPCDRCTLLLVLTV